jgi:DNA-binding winged helix-turn-helix (wHTH) protein
MKYQLGEILLDTHLHCVMRGGDVVHLTQMEYALLDYLFQHADTICKRDDMLQAVWGQRFQYDTGTIDVHLHSLRRKLGFARQTPIESIRGVGIILHTKLAKPAHVLNIQDFAIQWIREHEADFAAKQLTPRLHLDPFVSEITISPNDLRTMLDGILQVLLPVSQPGIIRIKSQLTCDYFSLSVDINGTINLLRIPLAQK